MDRISFSPRNKSLSLIELLIALVILGVVVMAFASIEYFSRDQIMNSDKRLKVQNEAGLVFEHIAKEIPRGIGCFACSDPDLKPVDSDFQIQGDRAIKIYYDSNLNLKRDQNDDKMAYRYRMTGSPTGRYQVWFYAKCIGNNCQSGSSTPFVIATRISDFSVSFNNNYIDVSITACYWPSEKDDHGNSVSCNTNDNPSVTLKSRFFMPSVSIR